MSFKIKQKLYARGPLKLVLGPFLRVCLGI